MSIKPMNFIDQIKPSNNSFENELEDNGRIYEYINACNPDISKIPVKIHSCKLHIESKTGIIPFDLRNSLNVKYPATSPNLLVSFIKIEENDEIKCEVNASSQLFYIISGSGKCNIISEGILDWYQGDMLVVSKNNSIVFRANSESTIYWVTDEPLMNYLGVSPNIIKFDPVIIRSDKMISKINKIIKNGNNSDKNRLGILLGNKHTDYFKNNGTGTLTTTPILWSLLNIILANSIQKPHRHNSVALDLCVYSPNDNVYTLMGPELDENNNVKNPVRCNWESGSAFVTPPGWWHSHHNETDEPAWVLPVQDAGLHTYMRTLDIQFT
jgi:gentisate 1,2-dioxygenase